MTEKLCLLTTLLRSCILISKEEMRKKDLLCDPDIAHFIEELINK